FSPDGRALASAGSDKTVRIWNVQSHRQVGDPLRDTDSVSAIAFSPDGRTLARAAFSPGTIQLWDVRDHKPRGTPWRHTFVDAVAFSPDGRKLASGGWDGI